MGLGLRHKKLIYKTKKAEQLQENPITVSIRGENEETYVLKPLQPKDHPSNAEFRRVVSLMKSREDWLNIIPFLIGLQNAKRPLTIKNLDWLIRKAGLAGQQGVIIECVKQWRRTGVTLNNATVAKQLFLAIRQQAQQADFKGEEVQKALRQAQLAADLLNAPENTAADLTKDPKRLPEVIAVLLELSAADALDANGGKDSEGKVRGYAESLLSTWSLGVFEVPDTWTAANFKLLELVPVWHGINLALQVEEIKADADLSNALKSRMNEIAEKIESSVDKVTKESGNSERAGINLATELYHK